MQVYQRPIAVGRLAGRVPAVFPVIPALWMS